MDAALVVTERAYSEERLAHRHDFGQVVLPQSGRLDLDVEGVRGAVGGRGFVAVGPGVEHVCWAEAPARCLVLDLDGELMVHRKGATSAAADQLGIIPGSMGSPSYIVRGRGNDESLRSCSHGAGRRMGRNAARKAISEATFVASLAGTFSKPSMSYVDEAPGVYKDIETVIARQADLVDIVHTLHPIITLKGDSRARED